MSPYTNYGQDPRMGFEEKGKGKYKAVGKFVERIKKIQEEAKAVMNIEWDYNYYQPWSDNKWLVDEILAMLDEDVMIQ